MRRRWVRAGAVAVVAALGAVSCSNGGTGDSATAAGGTVATTSPGPVQTGGTLTVGLSAETDSFNPYTGTWTNPGYEVANAVMEPLASVDEQGIAHPYLAESISSNADFTTWTITVRPDITFQNGERLDAAAVKRNLDTGRTSGLTAQIFALVRSIDVTGDRTVTVTMSAPWATFPATLAMQPGYMAAPAMLDDPAGNNAIPIGTGPFAVVTRQRDANVRTRKNDTYWRRDAVGNRLPYLDAIDFSVIADAGSRANAMASGTVDAIDVQTPGALRSQRDAAARGDVQMITNERTETDELIVAFNTTREPFDDPIAREAMAYAIDQDKMASSAFDDQFPGAWGMFDESSPYYISKKDAGYPEPDADKARSLAQQYQERHGKPLAFSVVLPSDPQYLAIGQSFQADLKAVGIDVELNAIEQTQLIRTVVATGDFQAAGFILRSAPSPDQAYVFLASKPSPTGVSLNFTRFDDPDLTTAFDAFRAASDTQARIDDMKTVQRELAKNLQLLFLVHFRAAFVFQNDVHGMTDATYPGTSTPTFSPYKNTPFFAFAWKSASG